jgi:hypothetical protein
MQQELKERDESTHRPTVASEGKETGSRAATCGKNHPGSDPVSSSLIDQSGATLNASRRLNFSVGGD